jgi:hypothetical protein
MPAEYAVVVLHPIDEAAGRLDFSSKECANTDEVIEAMRVFLVDHPDNWRIIHVVHIEDLPMIMEPPPGMS